MVDSFPFLLKGDVWKAAVGLSEVKESLCIVCLLSQRCGLRTRGPWLRTATVALGVAFQAQILDSLWWPQSLRLGDAAVCTCLPPAACIVFKNVCVCVKLLQLCLTLCDPVDCSLPGSSVRGILQARILEWLAMPSSRIFPIQGSKCPLCLLHWQGGSLPLLPPRKPQNTFIEM